MPDRTQVEEVLIRFSRIWRIGYRIEKEKAIYKNYPSNSQKQPQQTDVANHNPA